ncbi:transketolase [Anaeromassilibacillus sp. An200]|nr:transketolase [Anaeromassilibacillus sp. An200]OUP13184.1 transketolase [Anaeromassilibacillus sp. An200]
MTKEQILYLEERAKEIRKTALTMIYQAQSGHPGGSFSAADVIAALYFHFLKLDPEQPKWEDRDRFVLSKGHVCPALYAALILRGFLPADAVNTLRRQGSLLQGHPDMKRCPGIDISTGSLGQGLSCAVGMAIAGKNDGKNFRTYALLGDGECNEGQIWEAAQAANKYQLDRLMVFVDHNGLQNDGSTEEIMPSGDLAAKFRAFGFQTVEIDGHSMKEITGAVSFLQTQENGMPKCVVCRTVKGKGVSFMENVAAWHGMAPNEEQYRQAMRELEGGAA